MSLEKNRGKASSVSSDAVVEAVVFGRCAMASRSVMPDLGGVLIWNGTPALLSSTAVGGDALYLPQSTG